MQVPCPVLTYSKRSVLPSIFLFRTTALFPVPPKWNIRNFSVSVFSLTSSIRLSNQIMRLWPGSFLRPLFPSQPLLWVLWIFLLTSGLPHLLSSPFPPVVASGPPWGSQCSAHPPQFLRLSQATLFYILKLPISFGQQTNQKIWFLKSKWKSHPSCK